jgi:hypothetical protein
MAVKSKICAGWEKIRQKGYTRGKYWQSGEGSMVYDLHINIKTDINYQIGKKKFHFA